MQYTAEKVIGITVLLVLIAALAASRWRKHRTISAAKHAQEAERARAEKCAQDALNALHNITRGLFGVEHAKLVTRVDTALSRLGHDDRATAQQLLPAAYATLKEVAKRYADLMDGRSVIDNIVTVHTHDSSRQDYTVATYEALKEEAQALAVLAAPLRDIQMVVGERCGLIERDIASAAQRYQQLESDSQRLKSKIDEYARAGFVVKRLRALLKTARIALGKARTPISLQNFLTASIQLDTAQDWMETTQEHVTNFLSMESELERQDRLIDARIESALAELARFDAQQRRLARRYSVGAVLQLRERLAKTRAAVDTIPEKLELFRSKLQTLDLYDSRDALRSVESVLSRIEMAGKSVQAMSDSLATFTQRYREVKPGVLAELTALRRHAGLRQGQTDYRRRRVRELASRFEKIHQSRRANPQGAYCSLLQLKGDIEDCERQSLIAHLSAAAQ